MTPQPVFSMDLVTTNYRRRLVTVRQVTDITHVRGTRYDIISVDGWKVLAQRGEFSLRNLTVYFSIDSFVRYPNSRFWEYGRLLTTYNGARGYLVKSFMFRGNYCQGLVFPIQAFDEVMAVHERLLREHAPDTVLGKLLNMSFDSVLGVTKYEYPAAENQLGVILNPSPAFIQQPSWPRIQDKPGLLIEHSRTRFQVTEKLDGLSLSVYCVRKDSEFFKSLPALAKGAQSVMETDTTRVGVCTQRDEYQLSVDSISWTAVRRVGLPERLAGMGRNLAIQGELVGSTLRGNSIGFGEGEYNYFAFAIFDIDRQRYLPVQAETVIFRTLNVPIVPLIGTFTLREFARDVAEIVWKAEGVGMKGRAREGLVFKGIGSAVIFKVISNAWLLEKGE